MAAQLEASRLRLDVELLIAEARGGSRRALDRLLEACSPYLLAVAKREFSLVLRSRLDPVDVVQDTLLKVWQKFPYFRGVTEADLLAWLRQILRHNLANECREHVRSAMRGIQREVSLVEAEAMPRRDDGDNEADSPDKLMQAREQYEALEGALQRLPENYRLVLRLHTYEELTFAQVGERLQCSAEAARKLWRRAAAKLARLVKGLGNS